MYYDTIHALNVPKTQFILISNFAIFPLMLLIVAKTPTQRRTK